MGEYTNRIAVDNTFVQKILWTVVRLGKDLIMANVLYFKETVNHFFSKIILSKDSIYQYTSISTRKSVK